MSELIDHLVATVAHKLRNPLAAASSKLQLMMMKDDTSKESLEVIASQLDRMEAGITDLVHFVTCEKRESTSLQEVPEELSPLFATLFRFMGDEVKVSASDGKWVLRQTEETPVGRLNIESLEVPGASFGLSLCQTMAREASGHISYEVDSQGLWIVTIVIPKDR